MDGGWTLGGRWVDGIKNFGTGWSRKVDGMVTEVGRDSHGRWTGWSRKVDGMGSEGGRDGHGRWTGWSRKVVKNERFTVEIMIMKRSRSGSRSVTMPLPFLGLRY